MMVSKNTKTCVTPNANPKICVTPNANQWNIGGIGFSGVGARVGHVHFMLFVSILCALGTQRKHVFSGIWA